jgi:hypothetical protein
MVLPALGVRFLFKVALDLAPVAKWLSLPALRPLDTVDCLLSAEVLVPLVTVAALTWRHLMREQADKAALLYCAPGILPGLIRGLLKYRPAQHPVGVLGPSVSLLVRALHLRQEMYRFNRAAQLLWMGQAAL